MRIISGKLKGKTISFLKSSITRPLKDSVKESIFNIIVHSNLLTVKIKNSNILDLYSGIGSFGLGLFTDLGTRIFRFPVSIMIPLSLIFFDRLTFSKVVLPVISLNILMELFL